MNEPNKKFLLFYLLYSSEKKKFSPFRDFPLLIASNKANKNFPRSLRWRGNKHSVGRFRQGIASISLKCFFALQLQVKLATSTTCSDRSIHFDTTTRYHLTEKGNCEMCLQIFYLNQQNIIWPSNLSNFNFCNVI